MKCSLCVSEACLAIISTNYCVGSEDLAFVSAQMCVIPRLALGALQPSRVLLCCSVLGCCSDAELEVSPVHLSPAQQRARGPSDGTIVGVA